MVRFGLAIFIAAASRTRLGTGRFFAIVCKMRPGKSSLLFLVVFKIILSSVVELIEVEGILIMLDQALDDFKWRFGNNVQNRNQLH